MNGEGAQDQDLEFATIGRFIFHLTEGGLAEEVDLGAVTYRPILGLSPLEELIVSIETWAHVDAAGLYPLNSDEV